MTCTTRQGQQLAFLNYMYLHVMYMYCMHTQNKHYHLNYIQHTHYNTNGTMAFLFSALYPGTVRR